MTTVTAYAISRVVNDLLEEAGLEPVSSQQVYNATQTLRGRVGNDIPAAEASEFVQRYVANRQNGRSSRQTTEELRTALGL